MTGIIRGNWLALYMTITKTAETTELGTVEEETTFHDCGYEHHTVIVRMGGTTINISMLKRPDGELTKPEIKIFRLKGDCTIFTEHDEKLTKRTDNHTLDCGEKFKCVNLEVQ